MRNHRIKIAAKPGTQFSLGNSRSRVHALQKISAYGGHKPVIIAKLSYTARNKNVILSKHYADVVLSVQDMKYTLLG